MEEQSTQTKEPTKQEWRGFWTLVAVQAQNAFNEKAVQFLLIPLGVWLWGQGSTLEYTLGAIFVLPYILFSPLVGWISDCFCKARIIQAMAFMQIIVMGLMLFCLFQHDIHGAIIWFTIFALQATVLSPAKKGIVKDMLGSKYLGFGSGIIEMSVVFVLLAAQIGVFVWYSYLLEASKTPSMLEGDGWHAAIVPTIVFLAIAVPVAIVSLILPRYPHKQGQARPFTWSLFYEHFIQLKYLWRHRLLRLSEIGISYFWFLAGSLFLIIIQIAKGIAVQEEDFSALCALLMSWLSGGVICGGVIASILCKRKNELGLIPFGAIGITISCLTMSFFAPSSLGSNICLALTGAFGAAYLVPLNAFLQDNCDPAHRGNIIAAGNLMDSLMGLVAVGAMLVLNELGIPAQGQFFLLFLLSLGITIVTLRLIPQEFIRMVGIWLMRCVYRPRIINGDRIPETGGALIVVNHVTYADALFVTLLSKRPIRFIVAEEFAAVRCVGWILEIFNSLPISTKNPREAIAKAAEGLKAGDLICIFPEGQLTRTGCLSPIRRGLEIIARRAQAPIIPVYMDGLWGSIFSFFGNRVFTKKPQHIPYPFTAAIGTRMDAETTDSQSVLKQFRRLSCICLEASCSTGKDSLLQRLEKRGNKPLVHWNGGFLTGLQIAAAVIDNQIPKEYPALAARWLSILLRSVQDTVDFQRYWMNAQQLTRVNALMPQSALLTTIGHDEPHEETVAVLWPILTLTPVHLIEQATTPISSSIGQMAGSQHMRRLLLSVIPPKQVPFYDFSEGSDISTPNMRWRPCHATPAGIVISMSMMKSVFKLGDGTVQLGMRARTRGLLLPGYRISAQGSAIKGPTLAIPYPVPPHIYIDESGFLAELTKEDQTSRDSSEP